MQQNPKRIVTFERVVRPTQPARSLRRRQGYWALALAVLALAGFVGATNLSVNRDDSTAALYAERHEVTGQLEVLDSLVWVSGSERAAQGVLGDAVEMAGMAASPNTAGTALVADQWVYAVTVREATPGAIAGGNFTVELYANEILRGTVFLKQGTAEGSAVEGARVNFAIGATFPTSALFYVVVKPYVQTVPVVDIVVKSNADGSNTWVGVGAPIDGQPSPTITLPLGNMLRLTAQNGGDDMSHNIGIKDANGANMVSFSSTYGLGGSAVVTWTPTAAGTYKYLCSLHAGYSSGTWTGTMIGTLTVTQ